MPSDKVCKTIHQYNKIPVPEEDMQKLLDIAEDYRTVKNYVYRRFGGISSLAKLYPGYTVQNEMTASGFREVLELPSVYFYLAVFDALGEIKSQWTRTKTKVLQLIHKNKNLTEEEKHYLYFLLKVNNVFEEVLNYKPVKPAENVKKQYEILAEQVDTDRLHNYLCRQVRKHHTKLNTDQAEGFSITERAYRYADHGIYISTKEKRKRIFILLTDSNTYRSQLYIKLYPLKNRIEIKAPVNVSVRRHPDYLKQVGAAYGFHTMLTTDEGHCYGDELGRYQAEYSEWMRQQMKSYSHNREDNPGRKKYYAKKQRMEERLHSYINHELNRFFQAEKPQTIYVVKQPGAQAGGINKKINYSISQWQRGYIKKRLEQKCKEQAVEMIEVLGKGVSNECSNCGAWGKREGNRFVCPVCGFEAEEKINTARNVKKRGQSGKIVY